MTLTPRQRVVQTNVYQCAGCGACFGSSWEAMHHPCIGEADTTASPSAVQSPLNLGHIRRLLAKHLEGMRDSDACHPSTGVWENEHWSINEHGHQIFDHSALGCPGYQPVPPTAEGRIDEGRLLRAIEAAGGEVWYGYKEWWVLLHAKEGDGLRNGKAPSLALAYLEAVGEEVPSDH